jgi:ABC-type protease/lipase transport system fused ATPase/permease subunit
MLREVNKMPVGSLARIISLIANIAAPTAVLNNQVTLGAGATPLVGAPTPCKSVTIENPNGNNVVYVGNAAVAIGTGYRLLPGPAVNTQGTVSMDIDDLSKVYVLGTLGNIISYLAVN